MIPVTTLRPFTRCLMTIGQIPTSYLVSMTYEEQLLWLCNYLEKTVIPAIDNNAEAVKEVQDLLIELKSYVDNYFENLDVQEEINNKLDEMAESGQLADIIAQYLGLAGVLAYDTISDMASATNIAEGSICKTLGETTYNDGKGAFYKVRTITSSDVIDGVNIVALSVYNTLIAEKIPYDANAVKIIDTTTNLINETISSFIQKGFVYKTLGFYSIGDGGNSTFYIDDTQPANRNFISLNSGMYAIPIENNENVLIYGVKNDGLTDNTSLLTSISANQDILYFPKGTYLFNKLNFDNRNIEIYGDGKESILKSNNTNTSSFFNFIEFKNGTYKIHDVKLDSDYIGNNTTIGFINTNDSIIQNCFVSGATSQRTINIQTFVSGKGLNNKIIDNYVEKTSQNCNSGALIECTGETDTNSTMQFLNNTIIKNNICKCTCSTYTGDADLYDIIETDNCKNTIIENNYCETTMHKGISLDTRNINTIVSNNVCISNSSLTAGCNGIEVTGTQGAELQEGIIENNIVRNFYNNGIAINARNYSVANNRINNSSRGILLLELSTEGNMITDNICTNISDYGISLSGTTAGARILGNNASIFVGGGAGGGLYIDTPVGNANNFDEGLPRISYLNGIYHTDNYAGFTNDGFILDSLSDGRLIFRNPNTKVWQSITKTNV